MSDTYSYHPEIPENCPLDGAAPVGTIYRSVSAFPPTSADFMSDVEARGAKRSNCKNWGCSVWQDLKSAHHAREIYDYFRTTYIVIGELDGSEGQVMPTPSQKQPGHATFWKVHDLDISANFEIALQPSVPLHDDPLGPM